MAEAVAEPVVQEDTQAVQPTETQAPAGTDSQPEVQTPADAGPDPVTTAIQSALEAEREHIREEERDRLAAEGQRARQQQSVEELRNHFPNALRAARDHLSALTFHDEQGQPRKLSQAEVQGALQHFEAYNLRAMQTYERLAYGPIEQAVEASLPKADYQKFVEKASGKPPREFLNEFAEAKALSTKAVKGMTLEDAITHSSKLKAEIAARDAKQFEAGRDKGRGDPPGDPKTGTRPAAGQNVTYEQMLKMKPADIKALPSDVFLKAIGG